MRGLLIARVHGVEVRLNWSVAVVAALISWSLADALFPDVVEGRSTTEYWVTGALTSGLFLLSLVFHELSHAMVARREAVGVRAITLWLFGGVAELESRPTTPKAALKIAAAGPAMSGAIGITAIATSQALSGLPRAACLWLGAMNLLLMAFNLLPAFPLDGGRIYQAWLWNRDGDEVAATTRATEVGLGTGAILVGLGVLQVVLGALVSGIWLMAIGWFLREAARVEWRGTVIERPLSVMTVAEVMSADPVTVSETTSIDDFISGLFHTGRHAAYPVTDANGRVTGLIAVSDLRGASPRATDRRTVTDLMTPLEHVATTSPGTPVGRLLRDLADRPHSRALVFADDQLVGIVSPSDLARLVSLLELAATRSR